MKTDDVTIARARITRLEDPADPREVDSPSILVNNDRGMGVLLILVGETSDSIEMYLTPLQASRLAAVLDADIPRTNVAEDASIAMRGRHERR